MKEYVVTVVVLMEKMYVIKAENEEEAEFKGFESVNNSFWRNLNDGKGNYELLDTQVYLSE